MGIYPNERRVTEPKWDAERELYVWTEEWDPFDGAKYRREVSATKWVEYERDDCFCCSCHDDYHTGDVTTDVYCRNHGFAGKRACEDHNTRGTGKDMEPWGDEVYVVDLVKLRTVQQERAHNRAMEKR